MRRSRGFTMMEMSVVISLCMLLLLLTAILFTTCTRLIQAQYNTAPQLKQFDAMVQMLRTDIWSAKQYSINDEGGLELAMDDQLVLWQKHVQDSQIIRTQGQHQRYFPKQQVALHFELLPAGIGLRIDTPDNTRPLVMTMLSAHLLKEAQHDR